MSGGRAIVCGGRDYADEVHVVAVLTDLAPAEIAHGGASGADRLAGLWAYAAQCPCATYAADWHVHGRAAGPLRNQRMLDEFRPDLVVAFPGGRGTADMVRRAEAAGVRVVHA